MAWMEPWRQHGMELKDGEGRCCFRRRKKLLVAWDLVLVSIGLLADGQIRNG